MLGTCPRNSRKVFENLFRGRPTVGHRSLEPAIGVRIPAPEQRKSVPFWGRFFFAVGGG